MAVKKNTLVPLAAIFVILFLTLTLIICALKKRAPVKTEDDNVKAKKCTELPMCDNGKLCIVNPASYFCECMGGVVEFKENPEGQYGVCKIDGKEFDEWEYYRSYKEAGDDTNDTPEPDSTGSLLTKSAAEEKVKDLKEIKELITRNPNYVVVAESFDPKEKRWTVHVYEVVNEHTATYNWYYVNEKGEVSKEFDW